ncbi:MAG TPA: glycosyltransferase, partial [Terriglobales bacterium]
MRLSLLTEIIAPYRIPVFNALARRPEIDLHVIFLAETDPTQRHWPVYQSEIEFSYQVLPSWRRRIGAHHVLLNRGTAAGLRRAAPEVILCGGYNYPASWTAWRWAHRDQLPFLLWVESTARDLRNRRRVVEWAKERFIRGCAGFVVPGQSSRKYLRSFGVDEKAIFTAPNAVDNDLFAAHAEQARREADRRRSELGLAEHFFLFVGRLIESKGIFDLLDAYGKLAPDLQRE